MEKKYHNMSDEAKQKRKDIRKTIKKCIVIGKNKSYKVLKNSKFKLTKMQS